MVADKTGSSSSATLPYYTARVANDEKMEFRMGVFQAALPYRIITRVCLSDFHLTMAPSS